MSERRFYYVVFSLLFSINMFVYFYKSHFTLTKSSIIAFVAFGVAYLFASITFRKLGWQKQKVVK